MPVKEFVNVSEAAELIGCTVGRIRQLLIAGTLRGIKANERAWLIPKREVDEHIRRRDEGHGGK